MAAGSGRYPCAGYRESCGRTGDRYNDLAAVHPDPFLLDLLAETPEAVERVVRGVQAEAERLSGTEMPLRDLLKRVRLPRLGRALTR